MSVEDIYIKRLEYNIFWMTENIDDGGREMIVFIE